MAGGQPAVYQHFPDCGGKGVGEAKGVGNGGTGLSHPFGHLLLSQLEKSVSSTR